MSRYFVKKVALGVFVFAIVGWMSEGVAADIKYDKSKCEAVQKEAMGKPMEEWKSKIEEATGKKVHPVSSNANTMMPDRPPPEDVIDVFINQSHNISGFRCPDA